MHAPPDTRGGAPRGGTMNKWMTYLCCSIILLGVRAGAQDSPTPVAKPDEMAPLNLVIAEVKQALNDYQKNRGAGADVLPPLNSADFEFKTTTATTVGGSINLFIFKFGVSHEKDVVNDVTYSYSLPKPVNTASF